MPIHVINLIEEGKVGGPQIRIMAVARALRGKADTVIVMPEENSDSFKERCEYQGIAWRSLDLSRITKEKRVAFRYLFFFGVEVHKLYRIFSGSKAGIVHVSGGSWQFKGVIAGWLAGKKVLWHLNDTSMPSFIRVVFKLLSPLADGYIFASERSRAYYGGLVDASKPQFVIPAPVDVARFSPDAGFQEPEEDLGRWPGKTVVGLVGNISRVKGLETFIRMAAEVNKAVDNVQFVVAGPVFPNQQKYYESLCTLASELGVTDIEFVGGREEIRPLLKRFDMYVCSSNAESSPISVWEAMAMALPIVSTDVGDVPLYVKDGESGYIAPVGDYEALAKYVCQFAADEALRQRFGREAREKVAEQLDITRCAEKHLEAYRAVLGPGTE